MTWFKVVTASSLIVPGEKTWMRCKYQQLGSRMDRHFTAQERNAEIFIIRIVCFDFAKHHIPPAYTV